MEQYIVVLNGLIQKIVEGVQKDKKFKELSEEKQDELIRSALYQNIVEALNKSGLDPKGEELVHAFKEYEGLKDVSDAEDYKEVNEYLTQDLELSSNAINLVERGRTYRESVIPRRKDMLSRFIVSKILKEDEGSYSLDENKFKEAYDKKDNYRKLAYDFVESVKAQQREAN